MKITPIFLILLSLPFLNFLNIEENEEVKALKIINAARGENRKCGSSSAPAALELHLDSCLKLAAGVHANDIYQNQFQSHKGSDGSSPFLRVKRYTEAYTRVGEAIAFTEGDFNSALVLLLNSSAHCKIIMDNKFTHVGISPISGNGESLNGGFVLVFGGN